MPPNADTPNGSSLPEPDDVQRVEVEAETEPVNPGKQTGQGARGFQFRFGRFGTTGAFGSAPNALPGNPPRMAAWICLILAWLFLGSSVPFTVIIGVPLALASVVLGAACLSRGAAATGTAVALLGSAGSFIVYLVGLFRFLVL